MLQYLGGRRWSFIEILVMDDGSRDGTVGVAERCAAGGAPVRILKNPGNRGKGYSVRHGMLKAQGEWALFTDADLSSPIEEIEKLCEAAGRHRADIAIGSRALNRALIGVRQPLSREYLGRLFNLHVRLLTGLPFQDTQCGFKLFRRGAAHAVFQRQLLDGFGFDVEALFLARRLGLRAVEVPVRWNNVEGTKVSALRGLDAFLDPVRVRWNQLRGRYRK